MTPRLALAFLGITAGVLLLAVAVAGWLDHALAGVRIGGGA